MLPPGGVGLAVGGAVGVGAAVGVGVGVPVGVGVGSGVPLGVGVGVGAGDTLTRPTFVSTSEPAALAAVSVTVYVPGSA